MSKARSFLLGAGGFVLIILLSPLIILLLVFYVIYTAILYIFVWSYWVPRGKDILFIYSDSPLWRDHVQTKILPLIEGRSIVLNWSERKRWLGTRSLQVLIFRHFGGYKDFNPMGLYFRPFRLVKTYRFLKAFKDYKHGNEVPLQQMRNEFFTAIASDKKC